MHDVVVDATGRQVPLVVWRNPYKLVVTKSRIHGYWQVTVHAVVTEDFYSYEEALMWVRRLLAYPARL